CSSDPNQERGPGPRSPAVGQHVGNLSASARHKKLMKFVAGSIEDSRPRCRQNTFSLCRVLIFICPPCQKKRRKEHAQHRIFAGMSTFSHRVVDLLCKCLLLSFVPAII